MKFNAMLTTANASSYEPIVFNLLDGTDTDTIPERIVRIPTIDGSAALYSLGKSDADRTFSLTVSENVEKMKQLDEIRNLYNEFCISIHSGVFKGMISDVNADTITFLVGEKL